jgi:hypothetical protein
MNAQEREMMDQALEQALAHSRELLAICPTITSQFTVGQDQQAIEQLRFLLSGLGFVSQALQLTYPLIEERGGSVSLDELPPKLEPLVEALENRDYPLVGDIVTYELEPILDRWSRSLDSLVERRSTETGTDA